MKRGICMIMIVLLAFVGAACTEVGKTGSNAGSSHTATATAAATTKASPTPSPTPITITETVLYDEQDIKITAKSMQEDTLGVMIKLLIENNTEEDLIFQLRNTSVNGYMIEPSLSVEVVAGKKANSSLTLPRAGLEACSIQAIADVEFSFHIINSDTLDTVLNTDPIILKTSIAEGYKYQFDDSGNIIYDENGMRIVVKGISKDASIFGSSVTIFIENHTGKDVTIQARKVSVNDYMIEPIFSSDVAAGKCAVDNITFMSTELEENDILEIRSVELSFRVLNPKNMEKLFDTNKITIEFPDPSATPDANEEF